MKNYIIKQKDIIDSQRRYNVMKILGTKLRVKMNNKDGFNYALGSFSSFV